MFLWLLLWLLLGYCCGYYWFFSLKRLVFLDFYPLSILPFFKQFLPNSVLFGLFCFGFFLFLRRILLLRWTVALTNTHPLLSLLSGGFGGWVCVSALLSAVIFLFLFFVGVKTVFFFVLGLLSISAVFHSFCLKIADFFKSVKLLSFII